jgi:hypothetical protein
VFWMPDILRRNPDPWSRTLVNTDPDLDPTLFVNGFQNQMPTKTQIFCLLLNVGTFTPVFKYNKSVISHKTVKIKVC